MKRKRLYLQTTEISASKTVAELVAVLVSAGAREVLTQFAPDRRLEGIRFSIGISKKATMIYALPAKVEPVYRILAEQKPSSNIERLKEQAERTAWRILLRWVQAQIALIEVGMVELEEVFLPYRQAPDGRTFYDLVRAGELTAGPEKPALPPSSNIKEFSRG
jgi:hypothetical protein